MVKPLIRQGEKAPRIEEVRANECPSQRLFTGIEGANGLMGPEDIPVVIILI